MRKRKEEKIEQMLEENNLRAVLESIQNDKLTDHARNTFYGQ